ncbi:MAG: B12-binding domain-containing radical SAM protein, partial [Desulfobacterales bacterium]|nr:B12-binding domain-containing radical SAM protein [Desulfobacterales bacterium]
TTKRTIPYGLSCIAGNLIKEGFTVEIFDSLANSKSKIINFPEEMDYLKKYYETADISPFSLFNNFKHFGYSFETIGKKARESDAFLIGISSLFTPYAGIALKTAETIKSHHPDCKIVMGGHHPTSMPETVMRCKYIDFVLRGEGEISIPLLAKSIKKNLPLDNIPGIVFRKQDETLHISEPTWIKDIEKLALPASHLIKTSFYRRNKKQAVTVVASRGCPIKCSYCSVSGASSHGTYRKRSVESVISEITAEAKSNEVGFIDFEDENLTLDKKWFLSLMEEIINLFKLKQEKPELRAMNGLFPNSLDMETIKIMKKAGFKILNLSLGSISLNQLSKFNRPDIRKAFEGAVESAKSNDMEVVGYIIIGAPFQDPFDSLQDILYLFKNKILIGASVFYPSPGSLDFELCKHENLLPKSLSLMRSSSFPLSHTTSRKQVNTLMRLSRILNFIKFLNDKKIEIPIPKPIPDNIEISLKDRIEIGKFLLSGFLYDREIRGVTPDGRVFKHLASKELLIFC